jgi:hypothetical protein
LILGYVNSIDVANRINELSGNFRPKAALFRRFLICISDDMGVDSVQNAAWKIPSQRLVRMPYTLGKSASSVAQGGAAKGFSSVAFARIDGDRPACTAITPYT